MALSKSDCSCGPASTPQQGVPEDLAINTAAHLDAFSLLDIVELANATGEEADDIGFVYFALSERFEVDRLLTRITALPRDERWHALARMALRYDLYSALAGLTSNVLTLTPAGWQSQRSGSPTGRTPTRRVWPVRGPRCTRSRTSENFDLATISVALRVHPHVGDHGRDASVDGLRRRAHPSAVSRAAG